MGKKSGPPAPDYTAAAERTAESNMEATTAQTWANRPTQVDPWGSVSWSTQKALDPATGKEVTQWTQNTQLDPRLQEALDSQIAGQVQRSKMAENLLGRAEAEIASPMDFSGLNPWGQAPQAGNIQTGLDFGGVQSVEGAQAARQRAEDAIYNSATSRLDPQWNQRQQQLEAQLANQGISRNSAAYSRAMDDFTRSRNDAYQQAQMGAITGGGAEAQRAHGMDLALRGQQVSEIGQAGAFGNQAQAQGYGQGMQSAAYQNQLRQAQLQEAMQQRGFSLNEIQALLSGQQVNTPQFQNFNQAGNWGGVDYSGAAKDQFSAAMDKQSAKNAATSQALGGAASIAMMFSDRATKVPLRCIARDPRGFGIWEFRYIGERMPRIGVIAQEVRRVMPQAVHNVRGVLRVDYGMLAIGG